MRVTPKSHGVRISIGFGLIKMMTLFSGFKAWRISILKIKPHIWSLQVPFWLLLYLLWFCGSKLKPWVPIRPWCTRTCSTGAQWPHHGDMQAFVLPTLTSSLQGLLGTREQAARDAPGPTFRCSQQPQNRWPERAHHHRNQEHPVVFATRVCVVLGLNLWENTIQAYFANLVTLFSGGLQKLFKIQLAVVQNTSVCGCECLHTQTPKPTGVLEWRCHRCKDRNQSEYHIFPASGWGFFLPCILAASAGSHKSFWCCRYILQPRRGSDWSECWNVQTWRAKNGNQTFMCGIVQVLKFNFKRIKSIQKLCRDLLYDQLSWCPKDWPPSFQHKWHCCWTFWAVPFVHILLLQLQSSPLNML